tara:strand:- start:2383 stop:2979 length:597 start_codon:yes stop_codon:yes gene_type:complete
MPKRCPPGFICIENMTVIFLIMFLFFACFIFYKLSPQNRKDVVFLNGEKNTWVPKTNSIFSTIPSNILMNPHTPPLKNNGYFPRDNSDARGVPINISTRGLDSAYSQMGILTRLNGEETILPIMGRPLFSNRSKWQYYTMSDKSNSIKLPMSHNGRSCTNEYGCNELMSGDTVYVEGYKDAFKATIYENSQPRYIPYL